MNYYDTIARTCRYGDVAETVFGDFDVLWENSESDYQGHASIFAKSLDGGYVAYEWTYGSCSGCDGWEADGTSDDAIAKEMRDSAVWLADVSELGRWYLMLEKAYNENTGWRDYYDQRGKLNAIRKELGLEPLPEKESNDE